MEVLLTDVMFVEFERLESELNKLGYTLTAEQHGKGYYHIFHQGNMVGSLQAVNPQALEFSFGQGQKQVKASMYEGANQIQYRGVDSQSEFVTLIDTTIRESHTR